MSKVFVLDTNFTPLNPIHSAQAVTTTKKQKSSNQYLDSFRSQLFSKNPVLTPQYHL
jgi:hypothetical protein